MHAVNNAWIWIKKFILVSKENIIPSMSATVFQKETRSCALMKQFW